MPLLKHQMKLTHSSHPKQEHQWQQEAALRGLPHVSRMDRVMQEVQETTEHVKKSKQKDDAHLVYNDGHWISVALDDEEEICLLGMDDNPQTY